MRGSRVSTRIARTVFIRLYQRVGEHSDKMPFFRKELCNPLKKTADLLCFVCLANQHAACGEIVGNGLVLAFSMEERRGVG